MNPILAAIFVYSFLTAFWAYVYYISPNKSRILGFSNFLIFAWTAFMLFYYVIEYKKILEEPLNVSISYFESITNVFPPIYIYLVYLNFKDKWKSQIKP